jgi:hypothetical protein
MVAMLAQGHLLVEGVPGLAKTLTVKTLAATCAAASSASSSRPTWCRPTWWARASTTRRPASSAPRWARCSPTCCWPTRSTARPAKVQSALLEVMQERQVTIAGETHKVPEPFLVMATQNPIETEGTYPLPEAQVDRFMMKVLVDYPTDEEEFVIVERVTGPPVRGETPVATPSSWPRCSASAAGVCRPLADPVRGEAGGATRRPTSTAWELAKYLTYGASPRATIGLIEGARRWPCCAAALRAARGHDRPGARRAAPPPGAQLRGTGRRPDRRRADRSVMAKRPAARQAAGPRRTWPPWPRGGQPPRRPAPPRRTALRAAAAPPGMDGARRLDGLLQGDYRTLLRGAGLDLADLREYQLHDDVRHIDWNVTARLQTPCARVHRRPRDGGLVPAGPERAVDFGSADQHQAPGVSPSSWPRWRGCSRATATAWAPAVRHGGRHGVLPARARPPARAAPAAAHAQPPRRRRGRQRAPRAGRPAAPAPKASIRRRSLVFVVSDFISEPGWEKPLGRLARATRWWPCACSTRWRWTCPTSAC